MNLQFLDFDYSEDEHGHACWDAMASAAAARLPELCAEVCRLLRWAQEDFPGPQGALEDGGDWDYALTAEVDDGPPHPLHYHASAQALQWDAPPPASARRVTLTLTLTGTPQFAQQLQQRWLHPQGKP